MATKKKKEEVTAEGIYAEGLRMFQVPMLTDVLDDDRELIGREADWTRVSPEKDEHRLKTGLELVGLAVHLRYAELEAAAAEVKGAAIMAQAMETKGELPQ